MRMIVRRAARQRTRDLMVAICLAAALMFAYGAGNASAHASYVSSDPPANAVLKTAPTVVTVHFAENVNPIGSGIMVYDAKRQQVSTASAQVDRADLKTMTVPMSGDGPGAYLVEWHTVSLDDGDPDIGAFTFTVNPTATSSTGTPHSAATSSGNSGPPVWVTVIVGLAGLIIGGGAGLFLSRRARS